jgi:hypothetical protein
MNIPHGLPGRIGRRRGPPGFTIQRNNAGVTAKKVYPAIASFNFGHHGHDLLFIAHIDTIGIAIDSVSHCLRIVLLQIGDNNFASALLMKALAQCFADTVGATGNDDNLVSYLH